MKTHHVLLTALVAAMPAGAALACATCGCALSSEAAMGYTSTAGWLVSLQYDFINQNQLRYGTGTVSRNQVASLNPDAQQEVENQTINRYLTLGVLYAPNADWNFRLLVPYIDRSHTTFGAATAPITPDQNSSASVSSLGDVKLIASWQGLLPTHNLGFQLGVKLPTGHYGGPNADGTGTVGSGPVTFKSGPNAGSYLDTSLQAGTGSTDLIVGAYYYQPVSQNFDAFVSGQFQSAVTHKLDQAGADYRPGNLASLSFGVRYEENPHLVPQVQVNITRKTHDQGALADVADTAGSVVYLSPGFTAGVGERAHVYAFLQLPVYSKLDGYQLFPRWTASVGMTYSF